MSADFDAPESAPQPLRLPTRRRRWLGLLVAIFGIIAIGAVVTRPAPLKPGPAPVIANASCISEKLVGDLYTINDGTKPATTAGVVPKDFIPHAALICSTTAKTEVAESGAEVFTSRREGDFGHIIDLLSQESDKPPLLSKCIYDSAETPVILLLDQYGNGIRPFVPRDKCGGPKPEFSQEVEGLSEVSITSAYQKISPKEMLEISNCNPMWPVEGSHATMETFRYSTFSTVRLCRFSNPQRPTELTSFSVLFGGRQDEVVKEIAGSQTLETPCDSTNSDRVIVESTVSGTSEEILAEIYQGACPHMTLGSESLNVSDNLSDLLDTILD